MTHHRPHDPDEPRALDPEDLDHARESRASGGDASAAGSIAEREALAKDGAGSEDDEGVADGSEAGAITPSERPHDEDRERGTFAAGGPDSDDTTQADAGLPGGTGTGPQDTAPQPTEEDAERQEEPLGDLAEEVRRRREQGEGRGPHPPQGSEGAAGKIEGGEW